MSEARRIKSLLRRAYEGQAWHGPSLRELLNGVTAEQAVRKPLAQAHSIWELVLHISAWESAVLKMLEGQYVEAPDEGDWPAVTETSDEAWQEALAVLESRHMKLRDAVARLEDERLNEPMAEGKPSAYFALHGVIQHTLYHAGQIALLKRG
ncbi:MAG: DinB family protein [Blastocatellia bacterium]